MMMRPCVHCSKQPSECKCLYYENDWEQEWNKMLKTKSKSFVFWCDWLPKALLYSLPGITGLVLFHEGFDSSKALHSNDGPLGYMVSAHMNPYGPGIDYWNDLYWIGGASQGPHVLSISNVILWILHGNNILIFGVWFTTLCIIFRLLNIYMWRKENKK